MNKEIPQLLRLADAAARLGVSRHSMRYWLRSGRLTSYKLGKGVYVPVEEIEEMLKAGRRGRGECAATVAGES
jgi:excisionase family DNA binding protein